MIKLEMLRCFSVVAETGNLAEAAGRIGRTQSALSMTLKQLESHLGRRLFESDRKNRLSPFGEQVLELALIQLRQFDHTVRTIETAAGTPQGIIRIVSIPSVVGAIFPSCIKILSDRHPGLKIELRDTDTRNVIDSLVQGQADFGVASGQHVLNDIECVPLFSDQFGLVCCQEHPLIRQRDPPSVDDILACGFVMNELCRNIQMPGFQAKVAEARLSAQNTLSLIAMIRSRNWVTILPETVAQIAPLDLAFREIAGLTDQRLVSLVIRQRLPYQSFAEELKNLVINKFKPLSSNHSTNQSRYLSS